MVLVSGPQCADLVQSASNFSDIYQHVPPSVFENPPSTTPLVSASSSLFTLFAQPLFHEEHHLYDQSTFSPTLQYARPEVSHEGFGG